MIIFYQYPGVRVPDFLEAVTALPFSSSWIRFSILAVTEVALENAY